MPTRCYGNVAEESGSGQTTNETVVLKFTSAVSGVEKYDCD